jgi:hypothetical protein
MKINSIILLLCQSFLCFSQTKSTDVVVYGGTASAITAAIKASKLNHSVLLICPDKHLGGMTASGLGFTDAGNPKLVGGLAKEFYQRIYTYYQSKDAWNWQKQGTFKTKSHIPITIEEDKTMWLFEPHAAEEVFESWLKEHQITILMNEKLDRNKAVEKEGSYIKAFYTLNNLKIEGKVFIDATYEGDLMAAAGVSYAVGRENNTDYDESYNGVQKGLHQHDHNFSKYKISPYKIENQPTSGLVARVSNDKVLPNGTGDHRIEAYCFRLCLTQVKENQIPITKPKNYNPEEYEILGRLYEQGWKKTFQKFDAIPNHKTDANNHGPFSFDNIGKNYDYPDATYERRAEIILEHQYYQQGLLYFTMTDPRVPKKIRNEMQKWGYAKDEFKDNNGFPFQLYVRESRRMKGEHVMTERDLKNETICNETIGMGSYNIDSHNTQRYITHEGWIENEGDVGLKLEKPYKINFKAVLPKKAECKNLIVPVCVSSTHIAYGSIRMEPVYMILGDSSAQIASLAINNNVAVQDVNYEELKKLLLSSGQIIE